MSFTHVLCNLESFRITREGHGVFGDEIRLEGWFLSHAPLRSMTIVFSDPERTEVPVEHLRNPSEGVWQHHGANFGEAARHCRFYTAVKVPSADVYDAPAILRAEMDNGTFNIDLGVAQDLTAVTGFTEADRKLVMEFESIGDNCEFGLMQRAIGTERMGLFRYSGIADVFRLCDLIERRFDGFCEGDDLQIALFGPEWIVSVISASMSMHTGRIQGLVSREKIEFEERQKLQFLANKFMDDLQEGRRTFVYRTVPGERGGSDGVRGMDRLYDALRSYGDCPLLWVNPANGDHPHGTVVHVRDRLFRGFIRRLTPYANAHDSDELAWLDLLGNARQSIASVVEANADAV